MSTTSVSLLQRLKTAKPDSEDWRRLDQMYRPMIARWLVRASVAADDIPDLTQNVLLTVAHEVSSFERNWVGAFRGFLRTITTHRIRAHWRDRKRQPSGPGGDGPFEFLGQLEDPNSELSHEWDREHDQVVYDKLLAIVERDFEPTTRQAFKRFLLDGIPALQVAAELGISENAVYLAKSRILERLREEAAGLLD